LDLLDVSITIIVDYNSSHIELLLDNESLTVFLLVLELASSLSNSVGQSVSLGIEPHLGLMTRSLLLFDIYGIVFVGSPV
jgi:hypothetical protein